MPKLREVAPRVRVGTPLVRHNLTVFPLFAEDSFAPASYIPIGAAIRSGSAKITEASEGGSVPTLALENRTDIPVLIIDGEELLGAKQNRISNLTVLAPASTRFRFRCRASSADAGTTAAANSPTHPT